MEVIGPRQIEFKVHGLTAEDHGRVPARVFATKLTQLVAALEAADVIANGEAVHELFSQTCICPNRPHYLRRCR